MPLIKVLMALLLLGILSANANSAKNEINQSIKIAKKVEKKEKKMVRRAGNLGAFYPAGCSEISQMIEHWNSILDEAIKEKEVLQQRPRAIIAPHAGYIYSGFTANIAHRLLGNTKAKRVIVIGPSHHVYFEGISGSMMDEYQTPCGTLPIDKEYLEKLAAHYPTIYVPEAHNKEHSTETQMPFIEHYLPNAKVIELIYGKVDYRKLVPLIVELLQDPENVVVISSDLSHFYTLDQEKKLDSICLEGVAKESNEILERGCEACGIIGIEAMIEAAKKVGLKSELLDYRTSADASGDTNRVVGYMSAIFAEK
jgi:AmmeMemoRadiSam system protein B